MEQATEMPTRRPTDQQMLTKWFAETGRTYVPGTPVSFREMWAADAYAEAMYEVYQRGPDGFRREYEGLAENWLIVRLVNEMCEAFAQEHRAKDLGPGCAETPRKAHRFTPAIDPGRSHSLPAYLTHVDEETSAVFVEMLSDWRDR